MMMSFYYTHICIAFSIIKCIYIYVIFNTYKYIIKYLGLVRNIYYEILVIKYLFKTLI